jgi:2-oxoisovalerate dehydrogenase E1 component
MAIAATEQQKGQAAMSGWTPEEWIEVYRLMYLSRRIDDREIMLKQQQKIFFQISGAGHEAMLVAAGKALRPGYDWFYPYYRDRALCLALGVTAEEMLLQAVGAAEDPSSGGRQMPSHWGNQRLNIVSQSSSVTTQLLQAVGCAEAGRYFANHPQAAGRGAGNDYRAFHNVSFHDDEVVYASLGEGSTSQGEFWESLSTASLEKLPVLFVVEDNGYAISTPVEVNTPGGNISKLVASFPNFYFAEVDGTDAAESFTAFQRAVGHCRARKGPAFVHGHVTRPYSHSLSDNDKLYRPKAELDADSLRDPLPKLQMRLLREGILDAEGITRLEKAVDEEVQAATDRVLRAPLPGAESVYRYVYSPDMDPTSSAFATEPKTAEGPERTMADLVNVCLKDEMQRDPRIIIFGEDVADCSREENLKSGAVKGKGGVFKLTAGLQCEYGSDRAFNSPLAEANIVGRAVGLATRSMKPVAEIQFFDYIWPAMHQLRNELPVMRWRSNNAFSAPAVVRVAIGGYLTGGAVYHSQCGESLFTHTPGMRVVFPSNALDANGLLRTALRCDDPVMFLEHKRLYRETYGRGAYPGPDYMIPFGKAKTVRPGKDITLITYGAMVPRSLQAAQRASRELGVETEVIDLRTLNPYDWEAIAESVRRTSRVIVAHEDTLSWGYGAEIAARIADELFEDLDAPVKRVAATDTFVAYQPKVEDAILPQPENVFRAIEGLAKF